MKRKPYSPLCIACENGLSTFSEVTKKEDTTQFNNGKFARDSIYKARYPGDADLVLFWEVESVTAKRVTIHCLKHGDRKTVAIKTNQDGVEYCYPYGQYSMCLVLSAEDISF